MANILLFLMPCNMYGNIHIGLCICVYVDLVIRLHVLNVHHTFLFCTYDNLIFFIINVFVFID